MKIFPVRLPLLASLAALGAFAGSPLDGQTFTWTPTAAGTNYNWNNSGMPLQDNWGTGAGGAFPNAAGATANVNNNIVGNQTIRLLQAITVGTLNLGDADASVTASAFTIGNAAGETFALSFDSGTASPAQLNLSSSANAANTLAVPVTLGTNLAINLGTASQGLTFSTAGSLATGSGAGARNVTVTGGTAGVNQFTLAGDLTGSGVVTNNSNTTIIITNAKTFSGTFVLNKGIGGSNTGSLAVTNGSIANAAEVVINGALSAGIVQSGGILHSGNSSASTTNPGQRLTQNRITLNAGSLNAAGQTLSGAALGTLVQDNVSAFDFNSGYSLINVGASQSSSGTILNIGTLERTPGATALVRSSVLATATLPNTPARMLIGNAAAFLKGAGGAEGSTTMSIIPWIVAANTNGSAGSSDLFATYTVNGLRSLVAAEFAASVTAGADHNVSLGNVALPVGDTSATINALRYTGFSTPSNIGADKTLILASGAVSFQNNNAVIGAIGNAAAGTLQFGTVAVPAEGVVWANGTNTNTIGASISGTLGLTKAGTGTLILAGANTFTGDAYVSGGTLQIGNGAATSNLTLDGDVGVANGALLSLFHGAAIPDDSTLRLENFGLFNGRLNLASGVNETVGALFFGDVMQLAGTWGSTGSGATFQNDAFFAGAGMLTVVPEPGSAALLLGGAGALLGLRRRRG